LEIPPVTHRRGSLPALVLAAGLMAGAPAHAGADPGRPDPDGARWWSHIAVLASDAYEGRLTGTPGYLKAADYVAARFKAAGLAPGGVDGSYFQPIDLISQIVDQDASRVIVKVGDRTWTPVPGEDLVLGARILQPGVITAPLVFIGYGIALPDAGYDDFAAQDLKGKIAVTISGGPDTLTGALKAHSRAYNTWKAVEKAGAVGLISIPNPSSMDIPWPRLRLLARQSGMTLADPRFNDAKGPRLTATINPASAETLFAASGHSFAEQRALSDAHKPIPGFPLNASLTARVAAQTTPVVSPNVVAVLPGRDPALRDEYVVVSAHLDHLGVGAPIEGDPVYHGAMDNASGVASLLEVGRDLAEGGARPKRSVLFVAVTGEEKGLLGSRYFAEDPTVPRRAIVADINMDEFLPLYPLHALTALGEPESTLGADVRAVAKEKGYDILPDGEPDRSLFVRSDQYSFIRVGVPSIALMFGHAPGSKEDAIVAEWNHHRYHAPQDNLTQPVDREAASEFNAYLDALIRRVADAPQRPHWLADSFFRRFEMKPTGGNRPGD
jgi:Zn-dependent M28 family amino/carboxypeptidase